MGFINDLIGECEWHFLLEFAQSKVGGNSSKEIPQITEIQDLLSIWQCIAY